ncbi:hypothetical protein FRB97_008483 [Tulasnella sp. 331]|nr:hypothetical protein FRB97_008483 [Tulasnella sp. 331]
MDISVVPLSLPIEIICQALEELSKNDHKYQNLKSVALSGNKLHAAAERLLYKSIVLGKADEVSAFLNALKCKIYGNARAGYVKTFRLTPDARNGPALDAILTKTPEIRMILATVPNLMELDVRALGRSTFNELAEGATCHPKLRALTIPSLPSNSVQYFADQVNITRLWTDYIGEFPSGLSDILPNLEDVAGPAALLCELIPGRPVSSVSTLLLPRRSELQALCKAMSESTVHVTFFATIWIRELEVEAFLAMAHVLGHLESMEIQCRYHYPPYDYLWLKGLAGYNNLRYIAYVYSSEQAYNAPHDNETFLEALQRNRTVCPTLENVRVIHGIGADTRRFTYAKQHATWKLLP